MKKGTKKGNIKILRAAKISSIIMVFVQISYMFVYGLMWDIEKNLNTIKTISIYSIIPMTILSFIIFKGISTIATKENLKSFKIILWTTFVILTAYNISVLSLMMYYENASLIIWYIFMIFLTAIANIIFGLNFLKLQKSFGNIVKGVSIPFILIGILFLVSGFLATSFLSKVIADIGLVILGVISSISLIIIFNKATKKN